MTIKKIFAFMLAFLLVAGSVVAVSAVAPPYSENFKSEEDMISALKKYEEQYPNYEKWSVSTDMLGLGKHLEYRQLRSIAVGITTFHPTEVGFSEMLYGKGVDITTTTFYNFDGTERIVAMVYYRYNSEEIKNILDTQKRKSDVASFDEGVVNGREYLICYYDADYTDYYLVEGECLIWVRAFLNNEHNLIDNIFPVYQDVYIPVVVNDSEEWFDKTLEKGYLIGDANSDGELNIKDATAVQKYLAKFGKVDKLVADFNGDLSINVKDATDIQKKLAGLDYTCRREKYPVTFDYKNATDLKLVEATMDSSGPLGSDELIENYDIPEVERYTTVIESVDEFKAFFGKTHDKYDEEFFEENSLIYLYRWFITSSIKYVPDGLHYADGVLYISAFSGNPDDDLVECAFGNYNIFFEVNKKDLEGIKGVVVSEYTTAYDD